MGRGRANHIQILDVVIIAHVALHRANNIRILFFEHIRIDAVVRLSSFVILFVLYNFVNEEQGQYLDTLVEEFSFSLNVGKYGLADLNAAQLFLADLTNDVTSIKLDTVQEFNGIIAAINRLNDKTVLVFVQIAGMIVQIESDTHLHGLLTDAGSTLEVKLQGGSRISLGKIQTFQIHIALRCRAAGFRNALHGNLLDQPLIIRFHCIQTIDHIIDAVRLMGSGITQRHQRMEFFETLLGLSTLHRLRLVNNQDRIRLGDDINRSAAAEFIQLHVNPTGVLAFGIERLRIDDHDVDGAIRSKAVNLCELCRIVDEEANLLAVFLSKVFLRHLEGLVDAFTDSNRWNNNDELAPAVVLVQLIHRFDVGVCFADAGLHLNGQVESPFQLRRRRDQVCTLNLLNVFQNQMVIEFRNQFRIRPAGEVFRFGHACLVIAQAFVHHVGRRQIGLTRKNIHHSLRSICLELLMLELQFHCFRSFLRLLSLWYPGPTA